MQLEKILQSQGFGTRRACRTMIREARVSIDGLACDDPFADFPTCGVTVCVDGREWKVRERAYLMLNKPPGYECSRQPSHHPAVFALLPAPLTVRGVQPVGRLDADASGLLLLSDDGAFIHGLSAPKRKVPKTYRVTTRHPVDATLPSRLCTGVTLHDDPDPVAATEVEVSGQRELIMTITEGRYHQVKRMVAAAGNRVDALHRVALGGLTLPADLAPGEWRWLEPDDLAAIGHR